MGSLAAISALILLSCLPVARADIQCDVSISGTNVCAWINHHVGVTIAAVGGTVTLLVLLAVSLCYVCRRGRRRVSPVMRYAPRDQPRVNGRQISAPLPAEHLSSHEPESYVFSVPGESQWQSSEAWTDVVLSKSSARAREQCGQ